MQVLMVNTYMVVAMQHSAAEVLPHTFHTPISNSFLVFHNMNWHLLALQLLNRLPMLFQATDEVIMLE